MSTASAGEAAKPKLVIFPRALAETGRQRSPASYFSSALSSGGKPLLEGLVLSLPGSIDEKPAKQPGTRPGSSTEPGIAADGAGDGADPGACCGAGQRALLGRRHIGAGGERHGDGCELFHGVPQLISETVGRGSVRSEIETARRSTIEPNDPATSVPS